ncbi:hypothetical protein B0T14DRAFT_528870 [Immersiella caudata]|uniref:Uncharacterized protein n=1 Tax=Immersiella caudata TaxID=314043 RepID=A0AA39WFY4_9PEZI|nr:hypothetical protein B0T14DRAFT_528870 [Immersiella caudata]
MTGGNGCAVFAIAPSGKVGRWGSELERRRPAAASRSVLAVRGGCATVGCWGFAADAKSSRDGSGPLNRRSRIADCWRSSDRCCTSRRQSSWAVRAWRSGEPTRDGDCAGADSLTVGGSSIMGVAGVTVVDVEAASPVYAAGRACPKYDDSESPSLVGPISPVFASVASISLRLAHRLSLSTLVPSVSPRVNRVLLYRICCSRQRISPE